jgi:uncharacterized membrane protein (UPF0136 family)
LLNRVCFGWKADIIAARKIPVKLCEVSEGVQSYPTVKSRVVALTGLIIGWTFFGARALHQNWAPSGGVIAVVVGALLVLSKSFNVEARFRAPRNPSEEKLVHRLRILNGAGAVGMLVSVIWLLINSSDQLIVSFIAPLALFIISLVFQGACAVLYRPFLIKDGELL